MSLAADYSVSSIPHFNARGLRRCVVPGAGCSNGTDAVGSSASTADFWCGRDGVVLMRITWMGYNWSFQVLDGSGRPIPDEKEPMEELAFVVAQELYRWMTEDAADLPPFDD